MATEIISADIQNSTAESLAITNSSVDSSPIGATSPSSGKFTTLTASGNATVQGNETVQGNLSVTGNISGTTETLSGALTVNGAVDANANVNVNGTINSNGDLQAGTGTFSGQLTANGNINASSASSVTVPTPATNDNSHKAASTAFVNSLLGTFGPSGGSVTLPGGLILKWGHSGTIPDGSPGLNVSFPVGFPSSCFVVVASDDFASGGSRIISVVSGSISRTGFQLWSDGSGDAAYWIAIGD
jgi:cytoskeletal protein CcmA (bactofilin family)